MSLSSHIVTHTHWDREWYLPLERFQQRLVALIDELLNWPPDEGESFLLDGQTIVIEDYLALRPDRSDTLEHLLRDGRLEAGPWYVLADELIPSGEALVRNLLAGRRALRAMGATPPPTLYCPDSFGHPAALASIARGFDLPLIVLWRGYGGARWPAGDTARWIAPNGDDAILFHLPRDGYEFGSNLPSDEATARDRWQRMRDELVPRSATGVLLIPHGADHHARQADHDEAIAMLEQVGEQENVHRSSLAAFARELVARGNTADLPRISGELRDSYGYTWTLQGTFGTRAASKRLNSITERLLLRDAEPWDALANRIAKRSRRALMEHAWRTLLAAHPHDTLCGCSIDAVAAAMELRLQNAATEGSGVRDDAIDDLIGHDRAAARVRRDEWKPMVVLRNAAPRARSGVAIVDLRTFIADVPVGPGSGHSSTPQTEGRRTSPRIGGVPKPQVLNRGVDNDRIESPRHYPDNDLVSVTTAAAWVTDVPAYGILCLPIGARSSAHAGPREGVSLEVDRDGGGRGYELRNAHLSVQVARDGDVTLIDRATNRRIESLIGFSDEVDVGDLYTSAPRGPASNHRFVDVRGVHGGPLRGELALRWRFTSRDGKGRRPRADVTARLTLDADAPFLRISLTGENHATDHRLRLMIRTGVPAPQVWADAAFGPVRRERLVIPAADAADEQPPPTAPLHRYVSLCTDTHGATIYCDGLAEYEISDDGATFITLVRSVGELSKNDLPERPGHAGWPTHTPGAQCLGPFEAAFAVMPHGPRGAAAIDTIERIADDVLLPLRGTTLRSALALPEPVRGAQLDGMGLSFSTLKESEDGEWVVARCVNVLAQPTTGTWSFGFPVTDARLARLDETPIAALPVRSDAVDFDAPPRGIITILVR